MTRFWPTPSEQAFLRFSFFGWSPAARLQVSVCLFLAGLGLWAVAPPGLGFLGLALILCGHVPLWVKRQTLSPGGATPAHEDVWAPVDADWLLKIQALERRGEQWDLSALDVSNFTGAAVLLGIGLALAIVAGVAGGFLGGEATWDVLWAGAFLLLPLWLNGMRTTWNPSELRKKGEALAVVQATVAARLGEAYELVPFLALREGERGKYPVDARIMLRPARGDDGFLGIQFQVCLNNVQGTDYPYCYAVVLGKGDFQIPEPEAHELVKHGVQLVLEKDAKDGVGFLVVRQYADRHGGWHTGPGEVQGIALTALELAEEARRANAGKSA